MKKMINQYTCDSCGVEMADKDTVQVEVSR